MNTAVKNAQVGTVLMLSSHLGNPLDIPARSLAALRNADLLIFEEDRPARLALKTAGVHRDYLKFSEHLQNETLAALKLCLQRGGTAAYMSDQGSPTLADPGRAILQLAYQLKAVVQVVPGPCSVTAALSACPFDLSSYHFAGFLPRAKPARDLALKQLNAVPAALVLLDTPYRLSALLEACSQALTPPRKAFLALDISGPAENYRVGSCQELLAYAQTLEEKLNFVLVLAALR